ncbi:hypothetical protein FHL15_006973 [Xylaria flabelliformis]|uniref:Uncharacterized protein n=1 Tax=Xylaria flabelliformis TaxID=2512241 RepID=A0A553HVX0_9PEZI|nr:hypothetical protein FHL15_006973 [Xylaria flabelliformis]
MADGHRIEGNGTVKPPVPPAPNDALPTQATPSITPFHGYNDEDYDRNRDNGDSGDTSDAKTRGQLAQAFSARFQVKGALITT